MYPSSIKRVIAYIRSTWGAWEAKEVQGEYLTDLVLAFTVLAEDTTTLAGINDDWNGWNKVACLKETHPHLRVIMSVGGWNDTCTQRFSLMTKDFAKRAAFAGNCMSLIEKRNLDGIDIDWEYPKEDDGENYIALLQDLRAGLIALGANTGKTYKLSTCVSGALFPVDMKRVSQAVDSVKIMAYDYAGSWGDNPAARYHAHLYPASAQENSTSTFTKAYLEAGVPPEKLLLGLAPYGKFWKGVPAGSDLSKPGYNQPASGVKGNSISYFDKTSKNNIRDFLRPESGFKRYWDDAAKQAFLYNGDLDGGTWVCYLDDQQITEIVNFAKGLRLGGIFYWEWYSDQDADLLKIMHREAAKE